MVFIDTMNTSLLLYYLCFLFYCDFLFAYRVDTHLFSKVSSDSKCCLAPVSEQESFVFKIVDFEYKVKNYYKKLHLRDKITEDTARDIFDEISTEIVAEIDEKIKVFSDKSIISFIKYCSTYLLMHTIGNSTDAILQRYLEDDTNFEGKINFYIEFDSLKKELNFKISDNGIGISKTTFDYWVENIHSSDAKRYSTKDEIYKRDNYLSLGFVGEGLQEFLWPTLFARSKKNFGRFHPGMKKDVLNGEWTGVYHNILIESKQKKQDTGWSLDIPSPYPVYAKDSKGRLFIKESKRVRSSLFEIDRSNTGSSITLNIQISDREQEEMFYRTFYLTLDYLEEIFDVSA